jgi:dTDP-4-amino-4,6-dideoxygalactose transaminase
MFEEEIADYTGAPYAVAVDSCTNAILLSLLYNDVRGMQIQVPKRTYISVPQSVMKAGAKVVFNDFEWSGVYRLEPTNVYDSAKRLTSGMYIPNSMMCLSFHIKKPIPIGKGGMVLTDDKKAVDFLKKMRYEGRTEGVDYKQDPIELCGYNFYMTPPEAAWGLYYMISYPQHAPDQIEPGGYPDLSKYPLFRGCKCL